MADTRITPGAQTIFSELLKSTLEPAPATVPATAELVDGTDPARKPGQRSDPQKLTLGSAEDPARVRKAIDEAAKTPALAQVARNLLHIDIAGPVEAAEARTRVDLPAVMAAADPLTRRALFDKYYEGAPVADIIKAIQAFAVKA